MRGFYFYFIALFILILNACSPKEDEKHNLEKIPKIGFGIHNISFYTDDIQGVKSFYKDTLGFDMSPKSGVEQRSYDSAYTTYVTFPDMSSLIIYSSSDTLVQSEIVHASNLKTLSIASKSIDETKLWLSKKGFPLDSVILYRDNDREITGWSRDSGSPRRKLLRFAGNEEPYLPNFTENAGSDHDVLEMEWDTYYTYNRMFSSFDNGVVGISGVQYQVPNLDEAKQKYLKMGFESLEDSLSTSVRFKVRRNQFIELVEIDNKVGTEAKSNSNTGEIHSVYFDVVNIDSTYSFLKSKLAAEKLEYDLDKGQIRVSENSAHGLELIFKQESTEQAQLFARLQIGDTLDPAAEKYAAEMYEKYCAMCHGNDRQGYAADNAPSLKSHSLLASSMDNNFIRYTIQFGRRGTAMGGYRKTHGGPLTYIEIELLIEWLNQQAGVTEGLKLSRDPIKGDISLGSEIYQQKCASCHGTDGEGVVAPAIGKSMLLATATDEFLKYAIKEGREGTPMVAFKDSLTEEQIDAVTAFLRTRASGWDVPAKDTISVPEKEDYILNPDRADPTFTLRSDLYVSAKQLNKALKDSMKIVILDARSEVAWRQTHIPGAIPVPYYEEPENFIEDMPKDGTWIVAYCACPHAASQRVINTLRRYGFENTAILDEGILIWAEMGYPVLHGSF